MQTYFCFYRSLLTNLGAGIPFLPTVLSFCQIILELRISIKIDKINKELKNTRQEIDHNEEEERKFRLTTAKQLAAFTNDIESLVEHKVRACMVNRKYLQCNVQCETIKCIYDLATCICRKEQWTSESNHHAAITEVSSNIFSCGTVTTTVEGSTEEVDNAAFLLSSAAYQNIISFARAITSAECPEIFTENEDQPDWESRLRICEEHRERYVPVAEQRSDTRLNAFSYLRRYFAGGLQLDHIGKHPLGLMVYNWLQSDMDSDVQDEVQFDCRAKFFYYKDVNDTQCVHVEVNGIITAQTGAAKAKNQCISRLMLLSGAINTAKSISKQSLLGRIFVSQPLTSGYAKMQREVKNGRVIQIEYIDSILTSRRQSDVIET